MHTLFLAGFDSWWAELATAHRVFLSIGVVSGAIAIFLSLSGLLGLDHDAAALGLDQGDAAGDAEAFSVRAITGFFLGLGWVGLICLQAGQPLVVAAPAGFAAGLVMMYTIRLMLRSMKSLKSDGTIRYDKTVGATGTVYVTIPPSGAAGGQVTVTFDNRNETLPAIQTGAAPIPGGARIRVVAVEGRTLTVEKA